MNSALFEAITTCDDDPDQLDELLTDLEGKNENGLTPLEYACSIAAYKCGEALLKAGAKPVVSTALLADLEAKLEEDDNSLVASASYFGAPTVAKCLIENGARFDRVPTNGWSALHHAANEGHVEVCALLLDRGVPIDGKNDSGETPLMLAVQARRPNVELIKLLMARGADVHVVDGEGKPLAEQVTAKIPEWRKAVLAALGVSEKPEGPDRSAESLELVRAYVGQRVSAALDGRLFDHVPATFWFFFDEPASLKERLKDDFEDEVRGWRWKEVVPVASVSYDDDPDHTVGWLFLDWRNSATSPSVMITTSDTFGAPKSVESLGSLGLEVRG